MQFHIGDKVVFKDPKLYHISDQGLFIRYHGMGPFVIIDIDNDRGKEYVYMNTLKTHHIRFNANRFELYTTFIDD